MLTYFLKCKIDADNVNARVLKTKNGIIKLKTPLSKMPLLGDILF